MTFKNWSLNEWMYTYLLSIYIYCFSQYSASFSNSACLSIKSFLYFSNSSIRYLVLDDWSRLVISIYLYSSRDISSRECFCFHSSASVCAWFSKLFNLSISAIKMAIRWSYCLSFSSIDWYYLNFDSNWLILVFWSRISINSFCISFSFSSVSLPCSSRASCICLFSRAN